MIRTVKDFPYVIVMPKSKKQWEVDAWCNEQFGPRWSAVRNRAGIWCCFWRGVNDPKGYDWFFKNESDAMMFALKWS